MTTEKDLIGSWVHSHEEDHDDVEVFRPSSFELPPSRGRSAYTFQPDGAVVSGAPGPADQGVEADGHWELTGEVLHLDQFDEQVEYDVVEVDDDILALRRRHAE